MNGEPSNLRFFPRKTLTYEFDQNHLRCHILEIAESIFSGIEFSMVEIEQNTSLIQIFISSWQLFSFGFQSLKSDAIPKAPNSRSNHRLRTVSLSSDQDSDQCVKHSGPFLSSLYFHQNIAPKRYFGSFESIDGSLGPLFESK